MERKFKSTDTYIVVWSRHLWTPSNNIEFCIAAVRRTPLNCGYMAVLEHAACPAFIIALLVFAIFRSSGGVLRKFNTARRDIAILIKKTVCQRCFNFKLLAGC